MRGKVSTSPSIWDRRIRPLSYVDFVFGRITSLREELSLRDVDMKIFLFATTIILAPHASLAEIDYNCKDPETQYDLNMCVTNDVNRDYSSMHRITQKVILESMSDPDLIVKHLEAQGRFEQYANYECDFIRSSYNGGSMAPLAQGSCLSGLYRERSLHVYSSFMERQGYKAVAFDWDADQIDKLINSMDGIKFSEPREAIGSRDQAGLSPSICKSAISMIFGRPESSISIKEVSGDMYDLSYYRQDGDLFQYACRVADGRAEWAGYFDGKRGRWRNGLDDDKISWAPLEDGTVEVTISIHGHVTNRRIIDDRKID